MFFQNTSPQRKVTHSTFHMYIVTDSSQSNFMSNILFDPSSNFLKWARRGLSCSFCKGELRLRRVNFFLSQVTQLVNEKAKDLNPRFSYIHPEIFPLQVKLSEGGGTCRSWEYEWSEKEPERKLQTGRRVLKGDRER